MKYLRHITSVIIIIAVLAAGTIVEKLHGPEFALAHVYGTWWFVGLWALVAVLMVCMTAKCRLWKRVAVGALHASFLLILAGALLTKLTGQHGRMKLEPNRPNSRCFDCPTLRSWNARRPSHSGCLPGPWRPMCSCMPTL